MIMKKYLALIAAVNVWQCSAMAGHSTAKLAVNYKTCSTKMSDLIMDASLGDGDVDGAHATTYEVLRRCEEIAVSRIPQETMEKFDETSELLCAQEYVYHSKQVFNRDPGTRLICQADLLETLMSTYR